MLPNQSVMLRMMELLGLVAYGDSIELYIGGDATDADLTTWTVTTANLFLVAGDVYATAPAGITSFDVNGTRGHTGQFNFANCPNCTSIALTGDAGGTAPLLPDDPANLATLDVSHSGLTTFPSLAAFTALLFFGGNANALPADVVDQVLVDLVAAGATGGDVELQGGDNDPPSGVGLAAAAVLTGRGWTVTTN